MSEKKVPFSKKTAWDILDTFGGPLYVYDEAGIRNTAKNLNKAFSWAKGYKNYFAVKATPTPGILKILHEESMGFDCSSRTELEIMKRMGVSGNDIFFTSNNTSKEDFEYAIELGSVINIDDIVQVPVFISALNGREYPFVALRYNPGNKHSGNDIIGNPTDAKYGMSLAQLVKAFEQLSDVKINELGLHTMVASNETNPKYFQHTAKLVREARDYVERKTKIKISFVNLGGGFGVAYKPEDLELDCNEVASLVKNEIQETEFEIFTENGRYITGPNGYLLTSVRYVMNKYKKYAGVDASMNNLMRPGMYGAYHHITVLGKENIDSNELYDVVGSLCENNDKFAVDRRLPTLSTNDLLVIHDAGAHGHSMGFNYNGLLKSAEVIMKSDGSYELIRRAETSDDYFRTVVW
jgi:diaminopimelate decarboxylase